MSHPKHTSATPGNKMTLDKAASHSAMSREEIDKLIQDGHLPVTLVDGTKMVEQRDLEKFSALKK